MQIALVADAYPPMKTSGAVQIRDLVAELCSQGHDVSVLLPDAGLAKPWSLERQDNLAILRLRAMATKDVGYTRRAIAEHLMSFFMYRNLRKSPLGDNRWEAVIWYSPSIFFGTLVHKLKASSHCQAYLVLRDIFPEWAVDMGLLSRGLVYRYFKRVERFQYRQADTIGVQTPSNLAYFRTRQPGVTARIEVLNNWLRQAQAGPCSIDLSKTPLAGRRNFVYTGNIGIAQGMDILIELANVFRNDHSVGFVFVGRGTALDRIRELAGNYQLDNILFYDEIPPEEIPGLLAQCQIGLVALDPRHRSDNIPGKFLAYMQAGLPVLANINPGNDLEAMIKDHQVGEVVTSNDLALLADQAHWLLSTMAGDPDTSQRCRDLAATSFSATAAARQIVAALQPP